MKVAIFGRSVNSKTAADAIRLLFRKLKDVKAAVYVYEPFLKEFGGMLKVKSDYLFHTHKDIAGEVDFLLSIGGDGTLLKTITFVRDSGIPIMGINTGRLGFLSSVSGDEIEMAVDCLVKKKYSLDKRTLLQLDIKGDYFSSCRFALNDITVQKADSTSMITINSYISGKLLNTYWTDGLIIATSTGSTAYSLSCGGPVVMPDSDNFVLTPIAPHNLNVRPVIISSNSIIALEIESRRSNYLASVDSHSESIPISAKIKIRKADFTVSLVKLPNHDFLSTLRAKLMWGIDKRNH